MPRGIWGCLLAFGDGFYFSPSWDYFFPWVLTQAWLLDGGGLCVCKAGAAGMEHIPAGCGTPSQHWGLTRPQIPGEMPQSVPTTHANVGTPQRLPVAVKSPWLLQAMEHNEVQTPRCAPNCSPQRCGRLILRCPDGFSKVWADFAPAWGDSLGMELERSCPLSSHWRKSNLSSN